MADKCFPDGTPMNPVNAAILAAFPNFTPTFAGFYPDQNALGTEPLLQLQGPGATEFGPPPTNLAQTISDYLTPVVATLSYITGFAKPIFDIIALIIGIINVLCSLVDPIKVAEAVTKLLTTYVPRILSLIPPFAGLVIALDVAKVAIAIAAALIQEILPMVEDVINNALSIADAISTGNAAAVTAIEQKLCLAFQIIGNQISLAGPINTLIQLINTILQAGSEGFCAAGDDSECCNACPAFVTNSPAGNARVVSIAPEFTLPGFPVPIVPATARVALRTAVASENTFGIVRNVPVGSTYRTNRPNGSEEPIGTFMADIPPFIDVSEETMSIQLTRNGTTRTYLVRDAEVDMLGGNQVLHVTVAADDLVEGNDFTYVLLSDEIAMYRLQKLTIGCNSDIGGAASVLSQRINIDSTAWQTNQNNVLDGYAVAAASAGLDPAIRKIGTTLRPIDIGGLRACLARLQEKPTDRSILTCFQGILEAELEDKRDFHDRVVCAAASSLNSQFTVSKNTAFIGDDSVQLSFTIRDVAGAPIMAATIPNTSASVVFTSDLGVITPTVFDITTGTYTATLTSTEAGTANVTAFFVTSDVCMQPRDGSSGFPPVTEVIEFIPDIYKPRRNERQYVQSRGGRRR